MDYIILCEDDHKFTYEYLPQNLFKSIEVAKDKGADILVGGPSWFENIMQVSENLYWVEKFTGLQFTVIFKKFFKSIAIAEFLENEAADKKISQLSCNKMLIYPFISTQKDFGYSDATKKNEVPGRIDHLFSNSLEKIRLINKVIHHYKLNPVKVDDLSFEIYDQTKIPTYVINLETRVDCLEYIKREFEGKIEFEITIVPISQQEIGPVGLWHIIRKIIMLAVDNDDDVIIICKDDHQFTESYSKVRLMRNIIEAHYQGADILSGGIGHFSQIIPLTEERFWMDSFSHTQFIVLYKKCFNKILSEKFDDGFSVDDFLSEIISNKMIIYPFISVPRGFGSSDTCQQGDQEKHDIFERCSNRINTMMEIRAKYMSYTNKISSL